MDWFERHLNWALVISYLCGLVLILLSSIAAFAYDGIKEQTSIMVIDLAITYILGLFFFFYATRWYLAKRNKAQQQ